MNAAAETTKYADPPMKWVGSKRRLLPDLVPLVPRAVGTYCEPFFGGGALYFALAAEVLAGARKIDRAFVGDANPELANLYTVIRDRCGSLVEELQSVAGPVTRETYNAARALDPRDLDPVKRAARVVFLVSTCFNGLWRENARGKFNTPYGKRERFEPDVAALCAAEEALNAVDVTIGCGDFVDTLLAADLRVADFAYFDPPYAPLADTSDFDDYVSGGFGCQSRVADAMRSLERDGVCALASNHATPTTRAMYAGLRMREVHVRRSIAARGSARVPVPELIVATWDAWGRDE